MPASFMGIYVFAALVGGLFYHLERLGVIFAMTLGLLLGFALFNNRVIDMPIFSKVVNRVDVIFNGEKPIVEAV